MITVRNIDLRPFSFWECWRMAPNPMRGLDYIFWKLQGNPLIVQVINPCRETVIPVGESQIPRRLREACRDVVEQCRRGGLRFLFYYSYPPIMNGREWGAAFLTTDHRTTGFLHYCEPRWPRTFFYCVSRLDGEKFLVTTDMEEPVKFPPDFLPGFRPYYRYFPEDVLEFHAGRLLAESPRQVEESAVGPLIAEVQTRYAEYNLKSK